MCVGMHMSNKFQLYETNKLIWIQVMDETIILDSNDIRSWVTYGVFYLRAHQDSDKILDHRYLTNLIELESVYSLRITRWIDYECG